MPTVHNASGNKLASEQSPYLLQHASNPVDWFPWGGEAFAKARTDNKPILLSIGYSTCHWCHVMERESFENPQVAEVLNRDFVSIKVDREERPDIDRIYMSFVQATVGHGGWPLNVFLTPTLEPFFGGTYWPAAARRGMPGFLNILANVAEVWRTRREDIVTSAASIREQLGSLAGSAASVESSENVDESLVTNAARLFQSAYDPEHGGFGGAPKFPQPGVPLFLLGEAARTGNQQAIDMVLDTCDRMAAGGIYDQLGGGFARYSVDAQWLVPHFEKMLYDNAQLAHLYLDAWALSGNERYAQVARGILNYVLRDMTDQEGGFYSAEDADSEGQEGKFYCWTAAELTQQITSEEARVVQRYHGITEHGNFEDHSHPAPLKHLNVLSIVDDNLSPAELETLQNAHVKMFTARSKRVRPHRDDKVLASWNGLMLGAMARAGVMLQEPSYAKAAKRNAQFLRTELWSNGSLYHRWRNGHRDNVEVLEGPAFALDGLLHLYQSTLTPKYLEFAIEIGDLLLNRFYDRDKGGFWQAAGTQDLILKLKPDYDGAEPSGNSIATLGLLKLGKIAGAKRFSDAAESTISFFSERLIKTPHALPWMLQALQFWLREPARVVIAGDAVAAQELLQAAHSVYHPYKVVLGTEAPVESFARSLASAEAPKAFVCFGGECSLPITDAVSLRKTLAAKGR